MDPNSGLNIDYQSLDDLNNQMLQDAQARDASLSDGSAQSDSTNNGYVNEPSGVPGNAPPPSETITANGGWPPNQGGLSGNNGLYITEHAVSSDPSLSTPNPHPNIRSL